MNSRSKTMLLCASGAAILAAGALAGWLLRDHRVFLIPRTTAASAASQIRLDSSEYKYVNPLLFSETPEDTASPFMQLKSQINSYISSATSKGNAQSVSVYFRDLDTGNWTGVNTSDTYEPSSMLKVVIMMATYKLAETDPSILTKELDYDGPAITQYQNYPPVDKVASGYYPIGDLINMMIVDSDNGAAASLFSDPSIQSAVSNTYQLLRLPMPPAETGASADFMSAESYSVLFRTLYNSTFFSWNVSDEILHTLSDTTFTKGLVAGVPSNITVAHKFGENTTLNPDGTVQGHELHDCGIVYYPDNSYLLCVMTKGSNFSQLEGVISGISSLVYQQVGNSGV